MVSPGFIVIVKDGNVLAGEVHRQLGLEFAGASVVAGGHNPEPIERQAILFAFAIRNEVAGYHLRQLERDAANVAQAPNPAAVSIGPTLPELLPMKSKNLVQQLAVFVGVIVLRLEISLLPGNPGAADQVINALFGLGKTNARQLHFEGKRVPALPALRVTLREAGFHVDAEIRVFAVVHWAGRTPFPLTGGLQSGNPGRVVGVDFAAGEVHRITRKGSL